MRNAGNVRLIGQGLLIFYGIAFLSYLQLIGHPYLGQAGLGMSFLFLFLMVGIAGVLRFKEWGRQAVILGNMLLFLYDAFLGKESQILFPPEYLFISIVTIGFYSQRRIKAFFHSLEKIVLKSVLVVDDDEGLIKMVQKILLPRGYSVLTALTGERGLQIARLQKPDLIILDVLLPGIKGREVCVKLKEDPQTRDIPVVFLTAKDSADDIKAEMAVGAAAHLAKPVNAKILLTEIRKILG